MQITEIILVPTKMVDDTCDVCDPVFCLPDAYDICNPDMNEDGGCDPFEDDWP